MKIRCPRLSIPHVRGKLSQWRSPLRFFFLSEFNIPRIFIPDATDFYSWPALIPDFFPLACNHTT